jgi:transcriptional regulator with XRE-family HTH domain
MDERERRQALADFLRTRRARLKPAQVGLAPGGRRRTPGLRREEVADLAHIGVSWYTLLEQAQDVHPSRRVLESLAQALRLSGPEQQHLLVLAGQEFAAQPRPESEPVAPALQRVIDALVPHPAFVIGRRWDVLAWNAAAELLFQFSQPCPPHPRNVLWRYFAREATSIDLDWETRARNLVAQFRADYARYPGDAAFHEVIADLRQASPKFRVWWEQQDVRGLPEGPRVMRHPALGDLAFEHASFQTSFSSEMHVKVYVATPETAGKLAEALAQGEAKRA